MSEEYFVRFKRRGCGKRHILVKYGYNDYRPICREISHNDYNEYRPAEKLDLPSICEKCLIENKVSYLEDQMSLRDFE